MAKGGLVHLIALISILIVSAAPASAYEFRVGGPRGWIVPTGEESETYNQWATRNRFHIGDALYFKYSNDSVLVVDREGYVDCNKSNPIIEYNDGDTTFWFDRHGYFYFISGEPQHCESGQKLIVRVMVHPSVYPAGPGPAPSPMPGGTSHSGSGWPWGPSAAPWSTSSAAKLANVDARRVMAGFGLGLVVLMLIV